MGGFLIAYILGGGGSFKPIGAVECDTFVGGPQAVDCIVSGPQEASETLGGAQEVETLG